MKLIGEEGLEMAVIPIHFRTWDVIRQEAAGWPESPLRGLNSGLSALTSLLRAVLVAAFLLAGV
jgi:hypothetical protein